MSFLLSFVDKNIFLKGVIILKNNHLLNLSYFFLQIFKSVCSITHFQPYNALALFKNKNKNWCVPKLKCDSHFQPYNALAKENNKINNKYIRGN